MAFAITDNVSKKSSFEEALDLTGFGKYNAGMLISCCLLILAMYMDIFGFSVVLPAMACDMSLNTSQQGLLSAIPLIGVIISSYGWGLCADTKGRRKTLLVAMPVGFTLSLASTLAPNFVSLAILKFLSVFFSSAANAAAFVLLAESVPSRHRSRLMFLMASATMVVQLIICSFALPIFTLTFGYEISWLGVLVVYRPWRLLMQVITLPCALGILFMIFLQESPKFLLSKGRNEDALEVFKAIFKCNTGFSKDSYSVMQVYLEEPPQDNSQISVMRKIFNQTAPLFKPPLLKNSFILYYLLLCAYMTSTGFTMWVPTLTNAYFTGAETHGRTFCEVASRSASSGNGTETSNCTGSIEPRALYATMVYSAASTVLMISLSFVVGILGKKTLTLIVFIMSSCCGVMLLFIRIPMLSIALFFMFLYVAQILGNVNTYLVELNPTHLRGMATCLSVVVARGFGFFSIQIIASLLGDYCKPMLAGYVVLVISGFIVATFLPADPKSKGDKNEIQKNNEEDPDDLKV